MKFSALRSQGHSPPLHCPLAKQKTVATDLPASTFHITPNRKARLGFSVTGWSPFRLVPREVSEDFFTGLHLPST